MTICLGSSLLRYPMLYLPNEYVQGVMRGHARVQLERDGTIRILGPKDAFPLPADRPQPEHYPLTPAREGSC